MVGHRYFVPAYAPSSQLSTGKTSFNFTFMLPCIVIHFYLNNQPDALITQIYCYKILHVSGILSVHHQEFSTVHSTLVSFMQVFDDSFQAESGWTVPSWLCLETAIKACMKLTSAECTVENFWWWTERMPETCRVL